MFRVCCCACALRALSCCSCDLSSAILTEGKIDTEVATHIILKLVLARSHVAQHPHLLHTLLERAFKELSRSVAACSVA